MSVPVSRDDKPAKVDPVAADLFLVTMRVPRRIVDKIDRVKKIRSHKNASGDLVAIFEDLLDADIEKDAKKHSVDARRKKSPAAASASAAPETEKTSAAVSRDDSRPASVQPAADAAAATVSTREDAPGPASLENLPDSGNEISRAVAKLKAKAIAIPATIAAIVWTRDGGRCQWRLANGEKCLCDRQVEFDHRISRAKGGPSTVENLWLLCREHNLLKARREFGDAHMEKFVRKPRRTSIDRSVGMGGLPEMPAATDTERER